MTPKEVAAKAESLRTELANIGAINYSNYKMQLIEYRRILNDVLVLIRENANSVETALASPTDHLPLD